MHHYKVVNGKCRFYKTRARLAYEKASKSYRSHMSNVYKRNKNAVMITNDEKFIVGGNAFMKVDSTQNITTAFLSRMKSMMRDHVERLETRRKERKRVKSWNDPVKAYVHMNKMYNKKSDVEKYYQSYQPRSWFAGSVLDLMRVGRVRKKKL